jgi:hypothetical protein
MPITLELDAGHSLRMKQAFPTLEMRVCLILKAELEPRISRINTDKQCLVKTETFTLQANVCL